MIWYQIHSIPSWQNPALQLIFAQNFWCLKKRFLHNLNGFLGLLCFSDCDLKEKRNWLLGLPSFSLPSPTACAGWQEFPRPALPTAAAHLFAFLLCTQINLYFNPSLPSLTCLYLGNVSSGESTRNLDCTSGMTGYCREEGRKVWNPFLSRPAPHHCASALLLWVVSMPTEPWSVQERPKGPHYCWHCVCGHTKRVTTWKHLKALWDQTSG